MALQSSGAISLDDIHVEAGGSTGSQATINDTDIRALISKSAGAQMAFNEWYGASASIQIASGNSHYVAPTQYQIETFSLIRSDAFVATGFASITQFTLNSTATEYYSMNYNTSNQYVFQMIHKQNGSVLGNPLPTSGFPANSGWTSVTLAGNGSSVTLPRAGGTYGTTTPAINVGSTTISYPGALWLWTGYSNIFPTSSNTTNFTVTLTP